MKVSTHGDRGVVPGLYFYKERSRTYRLATGPSWTKQPGHNAPSAGACNLENSTQKLHDFDTTIRRLTGLQAALAVIALLVSLCVAEATDTTTLPSGVKRMTIPGVHNTFAIGTNLFSGSTPETDQGFSTLRALGVKTIISVDGAPPNVEAARKHGIRYVHLPCGYDGINTNRQQQLSKAAIMLPGPIFVHCHHGAHRGPAAAAIMALAEQQWTTNIAEAWLHIAGTGTNYLGLYASVREFQRPATETLNQLPADFPERAPASGLVDAMLEIDRHWENLKAVLTAGYKATTQTPGLDAAHELNLLREHYREAQRLDAAAKLGVEFLKRLKQSEENVKRTGHLLQRAAPRVELDRALDVLHADCTGCHRRFRDD